MSVELPTRGSPPVDLAVCIRYCYMLSLHMYSGVYYSVLQGKVQLEARSELGPTPTCTRPEVTGEGYWCGRR